LFLTHFGADQYLTIKDRQRAQQVARKIFKNTLAAKDDMEVQI
jgi:hypothetical protein